MITDTWGISGPLFLALYCAALVAVVVLAAVHRRLLFAGDSRASIANLGPQQVAYLNGGDKLALYAALGGLRGAGAVGTAPDGSLTQSGPLPAGVTPLDNAVYNAAGRHLRGKDLGSDQYVQSALEQLRTGLERGGLAVAPATVRSANLWVLVAVGLLLVAVVRLGAGIVNDRPVLFLILAIAATVAVIFVLRQRNRWATTAARKGMAGLRRQHSYLAPRESPSYATYGASGAAMGVALYGAASLYAMDPAFAAEAGVRREVSSDGGGGASGGSDGGGGGGDGGGGGGCGGGGCGG